MPLADPRPPLAHFRGFDTNSTRYSCYLISDDLLQDGLQPCVGLLRSERRGGLRRRRCRNRLGPYLLCTS